MKSLFFVVALCGFIAMSFAFTLPEDSSEVQWQDLSEEDLFEGQGIEDLPLVLSRPRRQAVNNALDLALSHQDRNGVDRPVGRIHGRVDAIGSGRNGQNWNLHTGVGAGTVLHRSQNGRHSIGAGVYGSQSRGRFEGFRWRSRPDVGVGVGYRFRF